MQRTEELLDCRLILNGFGTSVSLQSDRMNGLTFSSKQPDEELLRSFLLTFRRFISKTETVFLFTIFSLCQKHLLSDKLKGYLIDARQKWSQQIRVGKTGNIQFNQTGKFLTPEYVTDLWINGYYFHDSPDKLRELQELLSRDTFLARHIFLDHLVQASRFISYTRFIVKVGFREGLFKFD